MSKTNYLNTTENAEIIALYNQYLGNPDSVNDEWRLFFEGVEFAPLMPSKSESAPLPTGEALNLRREFNVINLINGYRNRGHLFTKTNPVRERRKYTPNWILKTLA